MADGPVEDLRAELVEIGEVLVEISGDHARVLAHTADRQIRGGAGGEQVQARVQQPIAALGLAVGSLDAPVYPR